MSLDLSGRWSAFWYSPGSPMNLALARILLALTALWIVLSRPDLPSVLELPPELWQRVTPERRWRFLLLFSPGLERVLYRLLPLALAAAALGFFSRASCLASALLLYHFAPLETIVRSANPYLRGLTIPTLGLLVLSFSRSGDALALWPPPRETAPSWEHGWPLRLVQVFFCQVYAFAAYAKLVTSGLAWTAAENIRHYLLMLNQALSAAPEATWGHAIAMSPPACVALAWSGLLFELAFPLVLFWGRARQVLLPAAVAFHAGNSLLFHIAFPNLPLLLLFVDWQRLLRPAAQRRPLAPAAPALAAPSGGEAA